MSELRSLIVLNIVLVEWGGKVDMLWASHQNILVIASLFFFCLLSFFESNFVQGLAKFFAGLGSESEYIPLRGCCIYCFRL